jgi:hypothetical protein
LHAASRFRQDPRRRQRGVLLLVGLEPAQGADDAFRGCGARRSGPCLVRVASSIAPMAASCVGTALARGGRRRAGCRFGAGKAPCWSPAARPSPRFIRPQRLGRCDKDGGGHKPASRAYVPLSVRVVAPRYSRALTIRVAS